MRYILLHKSNPDLEAGKPPSQEVITSAGRVLDEMVKAGVLLAAEGLMPSSTGTKIALSGGKRTVTDGPFAETKELIAGIALIQVKSKDEAIAWALRFSEIDPDTEIEIRQIFEPAGT
jgi:hypothetical protein